MKPFIFPRISLALAMAAGLSAAVADTIKLKDGTVYDGTIVEETADMYGMDVKEGKGIVDYKKIPKADVAKVDREMPDERTAQELVATLKMTPDGLSAAEYEKRIKTKIQPWLDQHKTSKVRKDVEELLKLYTEEGAKAKAGDIKLRGVWITAAEVKWNKYNINARKLRAKMESEIKANKPVDGFSTFAELESGFVASVDYPLAVEAIRKVLPKVEQALVQAAEAYPGLTEERKKQTAGPDADSDKDKKKAMDALVAKEKTDFLAKVAALKKNKAPVVLFNPYDLKTITDAQAVVKKESVRLNALDLAALTAAAKKFEQGLKDLNDKAYLSAKSNIEAVSKIHTKDVVVKKKLDEANKGATDSKAAKPGAAKPAGVK